METPLEMNSMPRETASEKRTDRRTFLKSTAVVGVVLGGVSTAGASGDAEKSTLERVGHTLLGNPDGGFSEGDVREDLGLAVVGSFLTDNGTYTVDISDPTDPRRVGHVALENTRCADVKFHPTEPAVFRTNEPNNDAGRGGFEVLDVSDPSNPTVSAIYEHDHGVHNVTPFGDDYLLLSGTGEGMIVVDVSDLSNPTRVSTYRSTSDDDHSNSIHDVTLRGDLAFVAHWDAGFRIVDLSDPANPSEVAAFDYRGTDYENCHFARPHPAEDYAVVGDEIALDEPGPKHVIEFDAETGTTDEVAVFQAPQENANQPTGKQAFWWTGHNFDFGVGDQSDVLFSGDYKAGLQVFDLSDHADPERIAQHYPTKGIERVRSEDTGAFIEDAPMTWGAKAKESGHVYVTDMQTGLYVFELE